MITNLHTGTALQTRLAPTPSGYLHLGNVLSFATTLAVAQRLSATVMLRIDDYDQERVRPQYVQDVFDTLRFLNMPCDKGPKDKADFEAHFAHRHRAALYEQALQALIDRGLVFACTCSRADVLRLNPDGSYSGTCCNKGLPLSTPGSALRLHTPDDVVMHMHTLEGPLLVKGLPPSVRHFIVRKKDNSPSYQLCSVVDDMHFRNNLIVRGQDLWDSTLAQLYLSAVLEAAFFKAALFVHHPLLLTNGRKLSKSAGDTSVHGLRLAGKSAAEIYGLIGGMMGVKRAVRDWQELAAAVAQ